MAFKNARAMFFFLKLGMSGNNFWSGQNFPGKAAPPGFDTPPRWKGVVIVTPNPPTPNLVIDEPVEFDK